MAVRRLADVSLASEWFELRLNPQINTFPDFYTPVGNLVCHQMSTQSNDTKVSTCWLLNFRSGKVAMGAISQRWRQHSKTATERRGRRLCEDRTKQLQWLINRINVQLERNKLSNKTAGRPQRVRTKRQQFWRYRPDCWNDNSDNRRNQKSSKLKIFRLKNVTKNLFKYSNAELILRN